MSPQVELGNVSVDVDLGELKSATDRLNQVLASLPVEELGDGTDLTQGGTLKSTTVVVNQPNMPTQEVLGFQMAQAAATAAKATAGLSLDPNIASVLGALQEAPRYREKNKTTNTQAVINNQLVQIPASVRDLPGNLYLDNNNNYVRGEADQILKGLFGDLSGLVNLWAHKCGFGHKPLVWAGNTIYNYVELDKKVDYTSPITYDRPVFEGKDSKGTEPVSYTPSIPFNPEVDDDENGILLTTLDRWLYHLTVRNMVRIGKEQKLSVVEVLRCIIGQYDRDHKPRTNPVL